MSNLVKTSNLHIDKQNKRVIDTNELLESKLAIIREQLERENQSSFIPGLKATAIDVTEPDITDALFEDGNTIIGETDDINLNYDFEGAGSNDLSDVETSDAGIEPSQIIENANAKANEIVQRSIMQSQEMLNDAKEKAKAEAENIKQEAREQGYIEGLNKANEELERERVLLEQQKASLQADYDKYFAETESLLVEKITDIYQYFFNVDMANKKHILLHLISTTMRHIDGSKSFLIHVSRDDCDYVTSHKEQLLAFTSSSDSVVKILEDISLRKNQCIIETEGGIFDCSLDGELKELSRKLRLLSYNGTAVD